MNTKTKDIWVFPGGGNQTAYACGACKAVRDLGIRKPDLIVASSGGAANAFYYLAGQIDKAWDIWGNHISTKKILNGARVWKMFNRDAMVDGVFMQPPEPLNLQQVKMSPINIYVGVTNQKNGRMEFFSNRDGIDLLQLLKASMTVPFFSGMFEDLAVPINDGRYMDSRVSSRPELLLERAISFEPERILVFGGSRTHKYRYCGNALYDLWVYNRELRTFGNGFAKNHFEAMQRQKDFQIPASVDVLYLTPDEKFKVGPWVNSQRFLQMALERGYADTMQNRQLTRLR